VIIMMEKLDALAIRFYNWTIITVLSVSVYLLLLIVSWIEPKELTHHTFKQIRDAVSEFALGDKK